MSVWRQARGSRPRNRKKRSSAPLDPGDQIKVKRYEHGLTLDNIASKLGVSVALVKDWEQDRHVPTHHFLVALEALLHLNAHPFKIENLSHESMSGRIRKDMISQSKAARRLRIIAFGAPLSIQ